jgi:hypothetical protein
MPSFAPRFSVVIAVLLLAGCLKTDKERTLANGGVALDAAGIRKTFVGNTLAGQVTAGGFQVPYAMYLDPGGRTSGTAAGDNDRGEWHINDDGALCIKWMRWLDAKENCRIYYHDGAEYKAFVPQGGLASVSKVLPGNPRKLSAKTDLETALEQGGVTPLSAAEVRSELAGNTLSGAFKPLQDAPIQTYYGPDGKLAAQIGGTMSDKDKGEFHIDDAGQVCSRWHKWNDAKEACGKLYRAGDKLEFFTPTGSLAVVGKIVKGNSEKLEF